MTPAPNIAEQIESTARWRDTQRSLQKSSGMAAVMTGIATLVSGAAATALFAASWPIAAVAFGVFGLVSAFCAINHVSFWRESADKADHLDRVVERLKATGSALPVDLRRPERTVYNPLSRKFEIAGQQDLCAPQQQSVTAPIPPR